MEKRKSEGDFKPRVGIRPTGGAGEGGREFPHQSALPLLYPFLSVLDQSSRSFSDAAVPPSQATQLPRTRTGRVWLLPIRSPLSA